MKKETVLFVGSFEDKSKSGHVGGQMFACNSLIKSSLSDRINWVLIDTTARTNRYRSILERSLGALKRLIIFLYHLLFGKANCVLVFSSHGLGFAEKGIMVILAKLFGLKTILAPRSGHLMEDVSSSLKFKAFAIKVFTKCDYIICQGDSWKSYFIKEFSIKKAKLITIPNWIESESLDFKVYSKTDEISILFLGWIETNKGIYDILTAANELRNSNIKWILCGNGKEMDKFKLKIKEFNLEDKVLLKGWVIGSNKEKLLNEANIFVLPSYREGMPNAILEAMKIGLPVISTRVGGIPDVIKHKENGLLIDPGNVDQLIENVSLLISNSHLRKKIGKKAIISINSRHSVTAAVKLWSKILINE